ncbi:MAG: hypothetical protein AUG51_16245 [Acidobacteria bacterium 13_1_20CM_3_53_8]|nr:MAG: hypothetical protein AUG51_16245 [Acidobacteria bacterium 13_1_20CM_3_53_8]
MEGSDSMDTKEQEKIRSVCKHAVKNCLKDARFMQYLEPAQIVLFANREYEQAEYDKPDSETFTQAYIAAYAKAQSELMVHRSSPFSVTTLPSQRAANMMIDIDLYGFDMAYEWLRSSVEAAAIPQESEMTAP